MSQHVLSLEAPDTMNKSILRLIDTSVYNSQILVKCPLLQITLPGFSTPANFTEQSFQPGFTLNLTACDLGVQSTGCGTTYVDLPDGIYIIRYSVSPNDLVYVEYYQLRLTQTLNTYNQELCKIELAACEPSADIKARLSELRLIKSFFDAAKVKTEDCHDPGLGMDLLLYAKRRLERYIGGCKDCHNNHHHHY